MVYGGGRKREWEVVGRIDVKDGVFEELQAGRRSSEIGSRVACWTDDSETAKDETAEDEAR